MTDGFGKREVVEDMAACRTCFGGDGWLAHGHWKSIATFSTIMCPAYFRHIFLDSIYASTKCQPRLNLIHSMYFMVSAIPPHVASLLLGVGHSRESGGHISKCIWALLWIIHLLFDNPYPVQCSWKVIHILIHKFNERHGLGFHPNHKQSKQCTIKTSRLLFGLDMQSHVGVLNNMNPRAARTDK